MAPLSYAKDGISLSDPPAELPAGFSWSQAFELRQGLGVTIGYECRTCRWPLKVGEYVRSLQGPRGNIHYHDDCVEARDFTPASTNAESEEAQIKATA